MKTLGKFFDDHAGEYELDISVIIELNFEVPTSVYYSPVCSMIS